MVVYERYVDHPVPFAIAQLLLASAGLISAIDCINLGYFRDWEQTAEGHGAGPREVFACDVEKDISVNL